VNVIKKLNDSAQVRPILLGAILKVKHAVFVRAIIRMRLRSSLDCGPSLNERLNRGYDHSPKIEGRVHRYDREN
jgi:hypothetical protein